MEIKAKCTYDLEAVTALTHLTLFKKADPKKRFVLWNVTFLVFLAVVILEIITFGVNGSLVMLLIVDVVWVALAYFLYYIIPRLQYKALSRLKNIENKYSFSANSLKVVAENEEYKGETEIEYTMLERVYETSKYFFLFQTKNQVLIVDKTTVEGGRAEEIRDSLTAKMKDKYIICRY